MNISVTRLKHSCLEVIRGVERTGRPVAITRRGRVVARLHPSAGLAGPASLRPWERLQALGGKLLAPAKERLLGDEDFEALRSAARVPCGSGKPDGPAMRARRKAMR